jgi:adenylate cyclase
VNSKKFFAELQRRNVYRVAVAYGVVGWLLVQIATQVFPFFDIPNWTTRMVIIVLLLGFPVALVVAWIYELTPEGLQRTDEVAPAKSIRRSTGRKIDFVIIGVLLAVIAVMAWQHFANRQTTAHADIPKKSIAILPFIDLSQGKDQDYFTDGITEEIINSLAHIHGLFVVARTTAFSFKNKSFDIRDVGRQLRVTHVMEGSVRRGPGKVRVDAQLIDVSSGYHLWSESYDSTETDLFSVQADVARNVVSALRVELQLAETTQLAKSSTHNPEAYDLYLRGLYLLNKRDTESIKKGRDLFEQAVTKDPSFALGHAGIANAYILLGLYGALPSKEASRQAWPEVSAALAIDDNLAEAYAARGLLLSDFEWNWAEGEKDFRKALDISPNNAAVHHWYAMALSELGRFDEALLQIRAAEKQDPLSPIIRAAKARILFVARRFDEAVAQCRAALELEPNFQPALYVLAQTYASQHRFPEAIESARKYAQEYSTTDLLLAYVYAAAGMNSEAQTIVRAATGPGQDFSSYEMATVCSASHDMDSARDWLLRAIERRSLHVPWLRVDPRLDNLRADPRYQEIAAKLVPQHRIGD